jgi:ATP-binding cassette, subfamily B, bacterial PglK
VMEAIESLDRQITVILIAHRLSTVERCDRVLLLELGQISCVGSYRELASGNASFKKLVNQPGTTPS